MINQKTNSTAILACGSLRQELSYIQKEVTGQKTNLFFLDAALHLTPNKILPCLQDKLNELSKKFKRVVLGFGLCSNGVVGLIVPNGQKLKELIVPRAHDCMDFFLDSVGDFNKRKKIPAGYYFLTPGAILAHKDPLGILHEVYIPKMGEKKAVWGINLELSHYTHFVLILSKLRDKKLIITRAKENAQFFKKELLIWHGKLSFFRHIIYGPYTEKKFIKLGPGDKLTQEIFFYG